MYRENWPKTEMYTENWSKTTMQRGRELTEDSGIDIYKQTELTKDSGIDIYKQTELTRAGTGRWCCPRILPTWQVHPPSPMPSALPCLKWQLPINNQLSWHAPVAVSKNSTEPLLWQKIHCFIFNTKSNLPGTVFILTFDFFHSMQWDLTRRNLIQLYKYWNKSI